MNVNLGAQLALLMIVRTDSYKIACSVLQIKTQDTLQSTPDLLRCASLCFQPDYSGKRAAYNSPGHCTLTVQNHCFTALEVKKFIEIMEPKIEMET